MPETALPERALALTLLRTIAAGLAGAFLFRFLGLPAAWLSGAMVGVVALLATGARVAMPDLLRDIGLLFAGVAMGSAITPEMLQAMARYPLSLFFLALTILGITLAGRFVLMRLFAWPKEEALFGSLPGAMSAVLATSAAAALDVSRVAMVQAFRMFILVAILPSIVTVSAATAQIAEAQIITAPSFALMMGLAVALALLFERLNMRFGLPASRHSHSRPFSRMMAGARTCVPAMKSSAAPTQTKPRPGVFSAMWAANNSCFGAPRATKTIRAPESAIRRAASSAAGETGSKP